MWQQHLAGQLRNKKTLIGKHIRFKLSNIQNGWQLDAVGGFLDYNVWECTRYKTCIYIQYIYIYIYIYTPICDINNISPTIIQSPKRLYCIPH